MSGGTRRASRERHAEWLLDHVTRQELVDRVRGLFERRGPTLTRSLRRELHLLIDEQASRTLAACVALNESPEDDDAFIDCLRDAARQSPNPYTRHGLTRRDFL